MKKITCLFIGLVLSLSLSAQNTITTDTILQLSTCAGGNVIVPFTTSGNFPVGNVFTAQLSNALGQFTTPINIGTIPFNAGLIFATIPANTNFGFLYKIRVISSNPAVVGSACPNTLIITQVAQLNQITATPNDTICQGESVTLSALIPGATYAWSTGETTQAINVSQTGTYSVTVIDLLQCETDTSINITVLPQPCVMSSKEVETIAFELAPNPTSGKFQISVNNAFNSTTEILVLNSLGQKVIFQQRKLSSSIIEIDLSTVETGVYFVRMTDGDLFTTKKIAKK